jgi:hypothetical protein
MRIRNSKQNANNSGIHHQDTKDTKIGPIISVFLGALVVNPTDTNLSERVDQFPEMRGR